MENENAHKVHIEKMKKNVKLWKPGRTENIKVELTDTGRGGAEWILLAQEMETGKVFWTM